MINLRNSLAVLCLIQFVFLSNPNSNAFGQAPGDYSSEIQALQQRIEILETSQVGGQQFGMDNQDSQGRWLSTFDFVAWTVRDAGFEYAITDIGGVQDRGAVGAVLTMGADYENGFRMSMGRQFGGNGPELNFRYVTFDTRDEATQTGPFRATIVSADNAENDDSDNINTLGVETKTPDDRATSVSPIYQFKLRNYDIELAQSFNVSRSLRIRPNSAIRIANLDTYQQVTYRGGDFQTAFTPFQHSIYSGAGIMMGARMDWDVTRWLTLSFGSNGGATMGSLQTQTFIPDDEPGVPTIVNYNETRLVPLIETQAMLMARHRFGKLLFEFGGGYEFANWFNVADQRVFTDGNMEGQNAHIIGDQTLDGFVGRFSISR